MASHSLTKNKTEDDVYNGQVDDGEKSLSEGSARFQNHQPVPDARVTSKERN